MSFQDLLLKQNYGQIISLWNSSDHERVSPTDKNVVVCALMFLGRLAEAEVMANELYHLYTEDANFIALYGSLKRRVGKTEEALEILEAGHENFKDNSAVGNNYANLLIDLKKYDKARAILNFFDNEKSANRADIKANIERVNRLIKEEYKETRDKRQIPQTNGKQDNLDPFRDPLIAAFAPEEVSIAENQAKDSNSSDKTLPLPLTKESDVMAEQLLLAKRLVMVDPTASLKDCESLLSKNGYDERIYEIAGEAYITLEKYADAERCFMTAFGSGNVSKSLLTNLASLATMRGDIILAERWQNLLIKTFPESNTVDSISNMISQRKSNGQFVGSFPYELTS